MTSSLKYIRSHLLGAYFYQSWEEFEGTAFEIGHRSCTETSMAEGERMLGIIDVILNLDISEERFVELCGRLGINYREIEGMPGNRKLLEDLRSGMLKALGEQTLNILNEQGIA